ncbi:TetR/AcrR family transcriptional regulator [Hoyosella altamirensis]|uniref:AcrR family transcriptional regulator n=1 Tax=Hoyosella altamirensis TaxID=616997 RepID=A0A839RKR3_9ACTN|nr:TetR/AcrR family transcriptional regulator [Hoyosella altamirensis]MBB3036581.1 AcrR family transcriptional regulator [Hoyosella altamirensis]
MTEPVVVNRLERRKARTRAALIAAARTLLARDGGTEASIQEITDLADVGFGSFYNHFTTKAELFDAAVAETLDEHGALVDQVTQGIEDPAEVFAAGVRLTVRLFRTHQQLAQIITNTGPAYLKSSTGLAPRALRDIQHALDAGRFDVEDPVVALACTGGAILGALHIMEGRSGMEIDQAADEVARNMLRMFGLSSEEAREIVSRPLPNSGTR